MRGMLLLPMDGTGISAGGHGRDRRSSEEREVGFGNPGFGGAFCRTHACIEARRQGRSACRCRFLPLPSDGTSAASVGGCPSCVRFSSVGAGSRCGRYVAG
jgi:hypothetical protein